MAKIYLLLGGNIGNRQRFLERAKEKIASLIGDPVAVSSVFETQPWGFDNGNPFLNQLVIADTRLEPGEVMQEILAIEKELGRVRKNTRYTSRKIDIDILFYNDRVISGKDLVIPHPQLQERRFALEPLAELEPSLLHPVLGKTVARLLAECSDNLEVKKLL
jgi:2-amino-4-hydroxy-6-hydroxymethyldihydropteridine diphosphokinase